MKPYPRVPGTERSITLNGRLSAPAYRPQDHPGRVGLPPGAQVKVARAQIDALDKALDQFRLDTGRYPTTEEGLQALVTQPSTDIQGWAGPYLKKAVPADPWGRPYVYQQPGTHSDFDLLSYGKDGRPGGTGEDADVTNW